MTTVQVLVRGADRRGEGAVTRAALTRHFSRDHKADIPILFASAKLKTATYLHALVHPRRIRGGCRARRRRRARRRGRGHYVHVRLGHEAVASHQIAEVERATQVQLVVDQLQQPPMLSLEFNETPYGSSKRGHFTSIRHHRVRNDAKCPETEPRPSPALVTSSTLHSSPVSGSMLMFRSSIPLLLSTCITWPIIVDLVPDWGCGVCGGLLEGGRWMLFLPKPNCVAIGSGDGSEAGYVGDMPDGDMLCKRDEDLKCHERKVLIQTRNS